ncbi:MULTISPECIES: pyridoxal phosphate-dependent aminotransferase [Paraburkholderia]|uniref:pyridoxal phosphate-dependent aminotransferase n=1 Tax=Paraburkholderia TaxID=1822464 RepID=UPI00224E4A50|nr:MULTISPECIES: pyridoxal phosphate-dependent aminotransferase [Paraburkholderia]MCX4164203.1 pyridoxal phosphate-dependent aminotransferase [Paraburkholderia megapolitana]MDN7159697.1 pyridoxal phosphate-dependent aminotransferase [Paraburkholderia sp. CHISQ3]MDQ6496744.1 pyridoxal phosphate-dependent aminotransferase [Paraburkholderia megapolitana]
MTVSRLRNIPGIGVDKMGDAADATNNHNILRLENLDTDLRPPADAIRRTHEAVEDDDANSYLPFIGQRALREAVVARIARSAGVEYDAGRECVISAGGMAGVLNVLLSILEPGDEVVLTDPTYAGLINRVRLAGGEPRFARLIPGADGWRLDLDSLAAAVGPRTRALLVMSPSMPTDFVANRAEWDAIAQYCRRTNAWLVYDAAMERIVFDGRAIIHPASLPEMRERTITVGSVSKEYRMIGWRVGWIVGPEAIMADVRLTSLCNVVCQVGIGMPGATAALTSADDGVAQAVAEWQARRDFLLRELHDLPLVRPDGGWSLLIDTEQLGFTSPEASRRLFEFGEVAATPMTGWGPEAGRYLRFVFSNEPVSRLADIRSRVRAAWGV